MYAKEIGLKNTHESHSKSGMYYVETDPTGRYGRLDEVLGRGAMKTVYKAIDEEVGMEVAWNQVKLNQVLCSPHDLQRLYSEVHLLNTLSHPSVIDFYTCWIDLPSKSFNFVTEMFTSGTLREYRNKYKGVKMEAIKKWARQILEGLEYLHSHDPPVIHRDLKCDNIFVNGHLGQLKLGDFGLASVLRASHSAHSVIGTPEFMAPELYEEEYNELVDVYSFGMCMVEMLTCEYPYSECSNPAQIYKKVTSGKLPLAYYRIDDIEAQRFIGKCLGPASKRLSAKQLLLDPFLSIDELQAPNKIPFLNYTDIEKLQLGTRTNMTITGKLNPQHDTIFLKVQIADQDGSMRNIYFPFDIQHDTATDVAMEMVKELDIHDWEPFEIAEMIDSEISSLVPSWKTWDHDQLGFQDYPDHPCSSSSSSSLSDFIPDHLQGIPVYDDETTSQSSRSYSNLSYISSEDDARRPDKRPIKTRFCPRDNSSSYVAFNQSKVTPTWKHDGRKLTRNRSLVDVRSQLLHRSLVEEVNKRRFFKTVGDVENVGFQAPQLDNKNVRRLMTKNSRMK